MSDHADHEYLLLTLQWVDMKLAQHPDHPTLKGQRAALKRAIELTRPPVANVPSAVFQNAGPEAVDLRMLVPRVQAAQDALGQHFWSLHNDIAPHAEAAESALQRLSDALTTRLRKLCGVAP